MRGRGTSSIVASPVLVGAVTVLVVIVGVFLAYNANQGLPFVPTYELKAELPGGQKLIEGNDVRVGGFRVGLIDEIKPKLKQVDGKTKAIAVVNMKLEKKIEPLPRDTRVYVRPRSALGLKYLEITPGRANQSFKPGDTVPLSRRPAAVEYEDVFSTFDEPTRDNSRAALKGLGDAFAGRGESLNRALASLEPFFGHLTPVMETLAARDTRLEQFFRTIGRAAAQAAPVAGVQAGLFAKMAGTFAAISACPGCLRQTLAKSAPTLAAATASLRVERPFLADLTALSADLRPVAATLHRKLPTITGALEAATPVLRRSVRLNELTGELFRALDELARDPSTPLALEDLRTTLLVARPLLEFVAPYQTVCSNANAFFTGLSTHMANGVANGTSEAVLVRTGPTGQKHGFNTSDSERPADVPADQDPQLVTDEQGDHLHVAHLEPYSPAVDAQGRADCQTGQYGYLDGPWNKDPKYQPANQGGKSIEEWENTSGGGSHVTTRNDHPGLMGPTYVGRRLGIDSLDDVK